MKNRPRLLQEERRTCPNHHFQEQTVSFREVIPKRQPIAMIHWSNNIGTKFSWVSSGTTRNYLVSMMEIRLSVWLSANDGSCDERAAILTTHLTHTHHDQLNLLWFQRPCNTVTLMETNELFITQIMIWIFLMIRSHQISHQLHVTFNPLQEFWQSMPSHPMLPSEKKKKNIKNPRPFFPRPIDSQQKKGFPLFPQILTWWQGNPSKPEVCVLMETWGGLAPNFGFLLETNPRIFCQMCFFMGDLLW